MTVDELVDQVAPTLQRYLAGDLHLIGPAPRPHRATHLAGETHA